MGRLYVGNLPYSTNDEELSSLFSAFGKVVSANVITDRQSGRSKGFGFVEFETDEESQKAIDEMNGKKIGERSIIVSIARPREERPNQNRFGGSGRRDFGRKGYNDR